MSGLLEAFPAADRLELRDPPLQLVVCQIRFPSILALSGGEPPDALQRKLPLGNSRPGGIEAGWSRPRERGELPETYLG